MYDDYLKLVLHIARLQRNRLFEQAAWNTDKQIIKVNSEGTFVWKSEFTVESGVALAGGTIKMKKNARI